MSGGGRHAEKVEMLETKMSKQRIQNRAKKWWRRPGLASELGWIRHSLPLIGAEQRWVLTVGRRGKHCARRTWW